MSTKRDLVEAHSFSRRRLISAFVSGAPGGREVEPVRPGRAIVGGIALAVLLVAGGAIASVVAPKTPEGWLDEGMIVSKENGARYVVVKKGAHLQPIDNTTSAQLIFGGELNPDRVSQKDIDKQELGPRIGIYGAPDSLPTQDLLVGSGWTACTNRSGGFNLRIDESSGATPAPGSAMVIGGKGSPYFLVADSGHGAYRMALPADESTRIRVLTRLSVATATPYDAADSWINLFPSAPALTAESFPVDRLGSTPAYLSSLPDGTDWKVGQFFELSGTTYLIGDGAPVELDDFSEAVYRANTGAGDPRPVDELGKQPTTDEADWPSQLPSTLSGEPCALLDAERGEAASTLLATDNGAVASAGVGGRLQIGVAPSRGAYVLSAGHGDESGGTPWVIDSSGKRYRLAGPPNETATLLNYGSYAVPTIPDAWIEPFTCGPELWQRAALAEPDGSADGNSCARR